MIPQIAHEDERLSNLEDRVDGLEDRMTDVERSYKELRDTTSKLNDAQVRMDTYVRDSFKRSEEQNRRALEAIQKLDARYDAMEVKNQERHDDMIQKVNAGVQDSLKAVANSNPVWVTGVITVVTAVLGIVIGAGVAWGIAHQIL